jgi:hypothetical protein
MALITLAETSRCVSVSRKVFSRLTGFSERATATWEAGGKPDEPGLRCIREMQRFEAKLAEVVRPEEVPHWLDTPNDGFGGLKPLEAIERGEIDGLWNMVYYFESGVPAEAAASVCALLCPRRPCTYEGSACETGEGPGRHGQLSSNSSVCLCNPLF